MSANCDDAKGDCGEVLAELERYLDGECGQDLERAVRRHLGDCPPCLDRADFERELRAIIAAKCVDAAPSGLVDRIVERLRRPDPAGEPSER